MNALKYRADIDGLRALAVLSVVIYHVSPQSLPGGFLGVDIFFVISGYLISLIVFRDQTAGKFNFADFYARRIRRLFPALAIVLLATMVFGAFALFSDEYQRLGKHASSAIVFLLNFQLMNEAGYFDVASDFKPLLHLWSLSIEEQFYLVWPALLVVLARFRLRISWVIGVLIVGSFTFAIYLASRNPDALYFHPLARFWELLLGAALAFGHHRCGINALPSGLDRSWVRHWLSCAGMVAIVSALLLVNGKAPYPGTLTLIPLLGVVGLIASGSSSVVNRFLALSPIVWIGLISYPLYLWHWPLLSYIRIMESGAPIKAHLWLGAIAAVLLAALTYRFIEQPLRNPRRVRPALVGLGSTMVVLLLASFSVVASDGLPDRPAVRYVKAAEEQIKREPATDESCMSLFPSSVAPIYCRQHNPGRRMIGIIGDSHAHVLFPGFAEQAERAGYGVLLLANSGCPPLMGAVTGKTDSERHECSLAVEKVLSAILGDERIKHVILATRGPIYLTGNGYGPAEADYDYPPIAYGLPVNRTYKKGVDPFADGLFATLRRLSDSGRAVSYFLQVPELGVPPRNCFGRPLTLVLNSSCSVAVNEYRERMRAYRAILTKAQAEFPTMTVLDPEPLLCDTDRCQGVVEKKLMYADDDHLSKEGSRLMATHFLPLLPLRMKLSGRQQG
ncbi:MAG: acyltransferase [Gammaproteobacteria bacterium]|uniref:acyltransferase family protein n=1 Tax=Rhodoferax sp. TaxID=50421 RepID=UPI001DD1F937|nr:acyltransferase family protein [Rhodoferax sp.]MBU3898728.1 acyltransferase [Gammaproteobacteria bacterium]MBU3997232.1 acyltransferase [Gammaproteobacteria bacterium]MBU4080801.1 acyltransferase [Gammaproteobacteria bacterium]MBU4112446.1 acyltransferase [Gammaproteobacteria bacterium]MBU4169839.1 acyltransferase [Gammaproteobacteria bacterium]